ncbi:MAG: acyl-CoA dehydrogenase family protein [Pseudomonadota bacterium]
MDFDPTEEQVLFSQMIDRFCQDRYGDGQRSRYLREPAGFSTEGWQILAESGVFALPFSEDRGGIGGSVADAVSVMTALGRQLALEPLLGGPLLSGTLLGRMPDSPLVSSWIAKIIDGSGHLALAHAEPAARFALDQVTTKFSDSSDVPVLDGKKTFVFGAGAASHFIVSAVPQGPADKKSRAQDNIEFFLVDATNSGVVRTDYRLTDGSIACELTLSSAPAQPLSGRFDDLLAVVANSRIAACAEMVGIMEMLLDATVDYVKTRVQFGKPLAKFQVIQHRLADLYTSLEMCRSHLATMTTADVESDEGRHQIFGSKAFISKAARTLAEGAVQLHGGMGVTDELMIGHGLKRILVLSTLWGDPDTDLSSYAREAASQVA